MVAATSAVFDVKTSRGKTKGVRRMVFGEVFNVLNTAKLVQ
jgi:hypothetical protein